MIRIGALIAAFILPLSMQAATLGIINPADGQIGQTRSFVLTVYPEGETVYSVQADLRFDTAVLDVLSVEYASGWLPLTQAGYDAVRESDGVIVKTAGYPGGISTPTAFATITARLTGVGTGSMRTTSDTQVLNAESENVYGGNSTGSVVIRAASVPQAPVVTEAETESETVSVEPDTTAARAENTPQNQVAAAGAAAGDFDFYPFGLIVLALLIGAGALIGMIIALRRAR